MTKSDIAYLKLMLDTIGKIVRYVEGVNFDAFQNNNEKQSAVIMQLQVLGELAKRLTDDTRKEISLPWKEIIGLRDLVSHQYFKLDLRVIWETATNAVPAVEPPIKEYLNVTEHEELV